MLLVCCPANSPAISIPVTSSASSCRPSLVFWYLGAHRWVRADVTSGQGAGLGMLGEASAWKLTRSCALFEGGGSRAV